ncbi:hypothetical protein L4932_13575 [Staphylococcus aureus]|nr:hypothetical protein [Staphylococcus aureus]MDN4125454.1 hypothetical protein [Staphylococcus aureus]
MYNFIYKNKNFFKLSFYVLWFISVFVMFLKIISNDSLISQTLKSADLSKEQAPIVIITSLIGNVLITIALLVIVYITLRWIVKKITNGSDRDRQLFKSMFYLNLSLKFLLFIVLSVVFQIFRIDNLAIYNIVLYTILSFLINLYIFNILKKEKKYIMSIAFLLLVLI